ncbi:MAG: hypothetical protein L6Q54_10750 [Leptospiraceae bacterium]|nr:hypothetical protein [Leptospiraceae bacterium]MCK6381706.1 hypothetical protein [Leptospiraceae bacterium]NUM42068.1 hypothetical protein [Leptospiraceae bacterium]
MEREIESELNPELFDMVKRGQLSAEKILTLIQIKRTVDRFSFTKFTDEKTLEELKSKFGVYLDIITWGDYFQTEIGSQFFSMNDDEFHKIADTIRFDLISAHLIFSEKPSYFYDKVKGDALISKCLDESFRTETDAENIHLEILLEYFKNMELGKKPLSISDRAWYENFEFKKVAV